MGPALTLRRSMHMDLALMYLQEEQPDCVDLYKQRTDRHEKTLKDWNGDLNNIVLFVRIAVTL